MKEFVRKTGPVIPSVNAIQVGHVEKKVRGSFAAGKASHTCLDPCPTLGSGKGSRNRNMVIVPDVRAHNMDLPVLAIKYRS